uniref:Uncharacterized protein n=1 Tax=Streptomyces auratus AGR0001 TaxID=1160718 RepID=J2K5P9_9ACTN
MAVLVGAAVGRDGAAGAVEAAGGSVGPGLFRAVVGLALRVGCPVSDEESGAVAVGVAECGEAACGTNGELMLGPPSIALISTAT